MEILSEKKEALYNLLKKSKDRELSNLYLDSENFNGRYISVGGKKLLHFANCSYLGLENDPRLIDAATVAAQKYGIILSNSRSYLSSPLYKELQEELNKMLPGYPLPTITTTLGHCSALPLLVDSDDLIILDAHVHNSIQMSARLCEQKGTTIKYLRIHNDMEQLDQLVNHSDNDKYKRIWFLADGIYSMQGEYINITALKELLDKKENLYTYIDDAHGFSWTGKNGAGFVLGSSGELHKKMIVALSMSKSFGCGGGILVFPNKSLRDRVRLLGQTEIFSNPISNPVLGAAIASAKIHQLPELEIYQKELSDIIIYFKEECRRKNIPLDTKANTPIQFIKIGNNEEVYEVISKLINCGIYCSGAVYPAMPKNHCGLRISLTRHLKTEDIDYLTDSLKQIIETSILVKETI
ncbi:aminotransferase class I/II-fold pyridoxal phosphate-dependent enzyme [Bernardetia sp. ABR2-2B]|uniref:aminotransferase class I/II-fold pyridoxal phosphate-dependent enzyme n=1 Tax=Bernardetia sp. ABR2-2B TaxID=3127472 RepID=UPI0030CD9AD8